MFTAAVLAEAAASTPAEFWMSAATCVATLVLVGDRLWPGASTKGKKGADTHLVNSLATLSDNVAKMADSQRSLNEAVKVTHELSHARHEEIMRAFTNGRG